jgi:hypothetical protein
MLMMKKSIISTFIGLILTCSMIAQVDMHPWAPTGATWLYRASSQTSQLYFKLSYQKDTSFSGKNVKKIVVSRFEYIGIPPNLVRTKEVFVRNEYMYNSQDSVFWYNDNTFQLLYVFSAVNGSSWDIQKSNYFTCINGSSTPNSNLLTVRAVQEATMGSRQFTVIDANPQPYWTIGTRLIKNIGSTRTPFPLPGNLGCSVIDGNIGQPDGLICYYDNLRGSIDFGGFGNCQGLITKIKNPDENVSKSFALFPNPTSSNLQLVNSLSLEVESVNILDMLGKQHISLRNMGSNNLEIDVSSLPNGMYVIVLQTSNKINHTIKFVKIK